MSVLRGKLRQLLPLSNCTSWKIGGIAKQAYKPLDVEDLAVFLSQLPSAEPLLWLGLGSNTLIQEQAFPGTVILTQGALSNLERLEDFRIRVGAGVPLPVLARWCARQSLESLEFLVGIPGTLGGALAMNAGSYDHEIWEYVRAVEVITRDGQIIKRSPKDYSIDYRCVIGNENEWFLAAELQLKRGDRIKSLERIRAVLAHRNLTQPHQPSAGSVFRNPVNHYAGKLIESLGLKGKKIGQARISEKHANFIINEGGASSHDIVALIQLIRENVLHQYQIELIPEVCIYPDLPCVKSGNR